MNLKKIIAAFLSFSLMCSAIQATEHMFRTLPAAAETQQAVAAGEFFNPCNKQDDKEVPYDGSRWIQPVSWNTPTVDPRDYEGGIMLFFDKIGLEPDYAKGKTQRVYFSIVGTTVPVNHIKLHIFYDTRLKIKPNGNGEPVTAGNAVNGFSTGSKLIEEGQIAYYATSNESVLLPNASLFTIDFIVPENAEPGEIYPIGISYVDDGIVADCFINSPFDNGGILQMTYVFRKGIYNGYIRIIGEKQTTTTTTAPVILPDFLGDVDLDETITADDAQMALMAYLNQLAGNPPIISEMQKNLADVDRSGTVNADDAQNILIYAIKTLAGLNPVWSEIIQK